MATLYIDNTNYTSELTGTDWTFTNGSATVSSAANGTAQTDGVAVGDYIRDNGGSQWYKVTAIPTELSITVTPVFQQATATPVGVNWSDASTDNGTTTGLAFCHPSQYTTDTVRSAGDIGKIRANQTHKSGGIDIPFDESGTPAAYIACKGCDSVDDPWSDSSDVVTSIDKGGTVQQIVVINDNYIEFENLKFTNSTDEILFFNNSKGGKLTDLGIYDGADGICLYNSTGTTINNCNLYDNTIHNLTASHGSTCVINSTFNGGASGTDNGIYSSGGYIEVINCSFGQTTSHDLDDIRSIQGGKVLCRNCLFTKAEVTISDKGGWVKSEDDQQVKGASWAKHWWGTIEKETTEVRSGGADNSVKVTPNSNCTTNHPFELTEWVEFDVPASSQTRSVFIEVTGISSTYPTNTELYFEAEYYSGASGTAKATQKSTAVLAANSTWVEFPAIFTPGQIGKVRYRVYLKTHESSEIFYIDNQMN